MWSVRSFSTTSTSRRATSSLIRGMSSGFRRPDTELPGEYAEDLLRRFGPNKLLWGSDAPFVGHEQAINYPATVALFRRWVPDAQARRAIGENGYRFYFAGAA